ncbi:MAG: hypothetical protein RIR91_903 [Verrucomicrobiota bacterium]|jgi:hypothetical protein
MFRLMLVLGVLPWVAVAAGDPGPSPAPIPGYHEAMSGDREAQERVGSYYMQMYAKSGIHLHFEDALGWFRKSARQGYYVAMSDLIRARLDGKPEDRDVPEAHEWLQRLHERARVETGYAGRLALLHASGELGAVDKPKAYFYCLIQRMTGLVPYEVGKLQARLKTELKPEQVAQAEKDAYDWWEDRNKPAKPVVGAPTKGNGKNEGEAKKDGDGSSNDGAVDTSEKAQALATKNRQENERRVKPLGKEGKYILPGVDDLEKRKK